jgi:outer membrane protein
MRRSGWVVRLAAVATLAGSGAAAPAAAQVEGELTLAEAVRLALSSNRDLQMAVHQLAGAEGQVREAWSAVYPTVNASAAYTRNLEVPGQFLPAQIFDPNAAPGELVLMRFGTDNMWNGQLRLEQPLFEAGVFIGVGAAARYRSLQEEVLRGRTHEVVTRAKQRYFDVLLAEEAQRLSAESVRRVRQALTETQAMQRAGLLGDYDVLRLEVELANLEPALRRATNTAEAARRALAVELGLDATPVDVAGSLASVSLVGAGPETDPLLASFGVRTEQAGDLAELVALARRNRSEVRQAVLTEQLHRTELRAEQAGYLPRISLFATYSYSAQADGIINPLGWAGARSLTHPQVGLQVSVPIFDGFRRPARSDQIRANLAQIRTQGSLVAAQVENQVTTLFEQVEEARLRAAAQETAVARARRGYEIASAQFREGLGTRLELTDAEVALRQSEFNLAEAVHDYLSARAQLDHAVGLVAADG